MIPHYDRIDSNETRESIDDETTSILKKASDTTTNNAHTDPLNEDSDKVSIDSFHSQMDDRLKKWLKKRNVLILLGTIIIVFICVVVIFILEPWKSK